MAVPLYLLWLHLVPHYLLWQVCAWLCLFIKDSRLAEVDSKEQPLPKPSAALQEVFGATFELAEILEVQLNTTDPHPNPNPNPNPNPDPNPDPNPSPDPTHNQVVLRGAGLHPAHRGTALPLQQQIRRHLQRSLGRHRLRHLVVPRLIAISMFLG